MSDPEDRLKDALKSPYNPDGELWESLFSSFGDEFAEYEETIEEIERNKFIDTADAGPLERLASIFDIERRTNESLDSFRSRLKVALRKQITSATIDEVIEVVALLTGLDPSEVGIREPFDEIPTEIQLQGVEDAVADLDMSDAEFVAIVEEVVAVGVAVGIFLDFEFDEEIVFSDSEAVQYDAVDVAYEATSDPEDGRAQIDVNSVLEPLFGDDVEVTFAGLDFESYHTDDVHRAAYNVESPVNVDVVEYDEEDSTDLQRRPVPKVDAEDDTLAGLDGESQAIVEEVEVSIAGVGRAQIDLADAPDLSSDWEPEDGGTEEDTQVVSGTRATRTDDVEPAVVESEAEDEQATYNIAVFELVESIDVFEAESTHITADTEQADPTEVLVSAAGFGLGQIDVSDDGGEVRDEPLTQGGDESSVHASTDTGANRTDDVLVAYVDEEIFNVRVFNVVDSGASSENLEVNTGSDFEVIDTDEVITAYANEGKSNIDTTSG